MSELGRNGITLTAVSDACSVVFSPSSCVVHADFDGSNPVLTYAYTDINVVRGDVKLAITTSNITIPSRSNNNITYSLTAIDTYTVRLQITAIPTTILNGNLGVKVTLGAFEILSSFPFTVVRESSMLDWIQDWDGRRTSIGGASIVTPKIFAGSKDSDNSLTGVYLGPDTAGAGIYGYKAVPDPSNTGHTITSEVFHINSNGASIGGWNIETGGITTVDSVSGYSLQLLSSGSIIAKDDNDATIYALYRSGEASFAKGNVLFHADGSAKFVGEIQAGSGKIGNWLISENAIHKAHVVLDSNVSAIMILAADNYQNTANAYTAALKMYGGVKMYYTSSGDYGMEAWLPATEETVGDAVVTQYHQAFALGSSNFIAGWHFDDERLYGTYAMIVGANGNAGLYVSSSDISGVAVSGLTTNIAAGTGIYITAHNNFHELAGYAGGNLIFRLGTNGHRIAGWKFDSTHIWSGSDLCDNDGFTQSSGSVIIGSAGILAGPAWRFEANGSGKLAGGKIAWAADGSGSIASGKIGWDASGNLTFYGGTVKSGNGNSPAWILSPDGSGSFASGKIAWTDTGSLSLTGTLSVSGSGCLQLANAGICSEGSAETSIRIWAGSTHANRSTAPFRVQKDGKMYSTGATLDNVHVNGVLQSTFAWKNVNEIYWDWDDPDGSATDILNRPYLYFDNISVTGSGDLELPCDPSQSGRTLTFTHYMTEGGSVASGSYTIKVAGGGNKLFENGLALSSIGFSREIIVLKGYGTKTTFFGWIVISRANIATAGTYGRDLRCIAQGVLRGASTSAATVLKYRTFDNSQLIVSRADTGLYTITMPSSWGLSVDHYIVMATGLDTANNSSVKPTITNVSGSSFQISISDDYTRNDGGCFFQIYNIDEWFDVSYRTIYGI